MKTLITLNLNGLTSAEESKRDEFYQALKDAQWSKIKGSTLDTTWNISWNADVTKPIADATIRTDIDAACTAAGVAKAKVTGMWAHDESIKTR